MKKILLFLFSIMCFISLAQNTTVTLTTSGSFVVPCGVTTITVQCWGSGGGGGGGFTGNADGGSGGGGGGYTINTSVSVTSGSSYNYTVGIGGNGGAAQANGTKGGTTTAVFGTTTITATGGNGGLGATSTGTFAGGTGGIGTFNGGTGGVGTGTNSGGGGEGASSTGNGTNGSFQNGGTSAGDGGDGPNGFTSNTGTAGSNGNVPGGGASGGTEGEAGGTGGRGEISITYIIPPNANAGADQNPAGCVTTATLAGNTASGYTGAWTCTSNCGGVSITSPTSANSSVTGLTLGVATTFQWVLTYTATGCSTSDNVIITPASGSCPPTNDDPTGATPIVTSASCSYTNFTTVNATSSTCGTIPAPGCASYSGGDVWFSVTVPASGIITFDSQTGTMTDGGMAVYSGTPCGVLTLIGCDDDNSANGSMPMLTVSGQTPGATLYVRFWDYGGGSGTFGLCATAIIPPTNDNCPGAYTVAVNSNSLCASTTTATSTNATQSLAGCTGSADDDVWFSFIAGATTQSITVTPGTLNNAVFEVFTGACAGLTTYSCINNTTGVTDESSSISGLTIGSTYFVRVYSNGNSTNSGTFSICINIPPPPPTNDECSGASSLTVNSGTTCSTSTGGTVYGATASTQTNTCGGTADDDVWYQFTATATSHSISITSIAGSVTDMYHSIYAGSCASIGSPLVCSDPNSSLVSGLTIGNVYYVRIYTYSSTGGQTTTFSVCVTTPPDPCTSITNIASCGSLISTTIAAGNGAYSSSSCGFTTGGNEKIFTYTPSASGTYSIQQASSFAYIDYQIKPVSSGCGPNGWTCIDDITGAGSSSAFTLTPGVAYYILLDPESTAGGTVTFSITCPPPIPTNDECSGATTLAVSSGTVCTTLTGGTVNGATASAQTNTCSGTADDDVWYQFTATATTHSISITNVAGSATDLYHSVYMGTCASIGSPLVCSDPNTSVVTGLTIGSVYYIRIYSYTSSLGQNTTFSLCVTTPPIPPPPGNDDCPGAYPVTVNSGTVCTSLTGGTLYGATASTQTNSCGSTIDDDDVWFSFVATATYHKITLNNVAGSPTDLYHSIFAGTCGSIGNAIVCSDLNTSGVNGLTIGNTYYVRVYSTGTAWGPTTTFSVCVTSPPAPPVNTSCNGMTPICSGSAITFQAQSSGGTAASGPDYDCLSTQPNPTWFFMEILTPGTMAIDMNAGSDIDFALWGPYANLAAAKADCSSYPSPIDCSYSSSNTEQANIASVQIGEVYALLVTNYADIVQNITLNQATGATATTNCAIILPVNLLYFNAVINESEHVDLKWVTETEQNNDYFELQKSSDGNEWQTIAKKDSKGNSLSKTFYNHIDENPFHGISYYRLKQVDFNQSYNYSTIISVDLLKEREQISNVHPNPTKDILYYDILSKAKGTVTMELVNYTGETILENNKPIEHGNNTFNIDISNFKNGVYLLKINIENSGKTLVQKIIKN